MRKIETRNGLTFEDTAEVIQAKHASERYLGRNHRLTDQLAKHMFRVIVEEEPADSAIFKGNEQRLILRSLRKRVAERDDSWEQDQSAHMIDSYENPKPVEVVPEQGVLFDVETAAA